jgi:glycosyltransferase involved in cell wall biosynthesis
VARGPGPGLRGQGLSRPRPLPSPVSTPRPARLVFLLQDLQFGGTQRQALELARLLDPNRFQVELWVLAAGEGLAPLAPLARDWGLSVVWLSRQARVGPGALARLWRRLREQPVDLLLPLTVVPNIWGRVLGRLARVPVIVGNCRGGGAPRRQHERWLWPLAHHIICNSAALGRELTRRYGVPAARVSVIPNGVDTDYFRPAPTGEQPYPAVVLSVARMVPDKDPDTLIRAFALAAPAFPQAQLWLVGEGPLLAAARSLAGEILPPGSYRFIPPQADLRPLFRQAGLLALSSRTEALPNVVLEAMAAGLPVAATAVGGVPELVTPAQTGWLAAPGDAPGLAAVLTRLLENPEKCRAYGRAGRRRAERDFSLRAMAGRYEDVLAQLLARAGG